MARFSQVMTDMTIEERKELSNLMIKSVEYDETSQTVTTTLYPLPELPEVSLGVRFRKASKLAEREGFEPSVPVCTSTTV